MKISNLKIILLLVLGAFTLTLPNTVRAEEKSKEIQWFEKNMRAGYIKKAGEADYSAEIQKRNELEAKIKKTQDLFDLAYNTFSFKGGGAGALKYVNAGEWAKCGLKKGLSDFISGLGKLGDSIGLSTDTELFLKQPVACTEELFNDALKKAQQDLTLLQKAGCPSISDHGKSYLKNLKGMAKDIWHGNWRNAGKKFLDATDDGLAFLDSVYTEVTSFATSFDWNTLGNMGLDLVKLNGSGAKEKWNKLVSDRPDNVCEAVEYIIDGYKDFLTFVQKLIPMTKELYDLKKNLKTTLDISAVNKGELYVYTDPKTGKKFLFEKQGDTIVSVSGVTKGCIPMPAKLSESQSCLFCPLFQVIFNAANDITTASAAKLATIMAQVLLLGFAIYVAFSVLQLVSSFTKQDGPKFITGLLGQAFKVLFAYVLLIKIDSVYAYIISPVLSAGLEFGSSLLFEQGHNYATLKSCGSVVVSGGILPSSLGNKILCFIKAVQAEIAVPQTIASSLMCVARHTAATEVLSVKFWDFGMMFQGILIYCFSWLISLAFAFYLIDATVRLGIVGALMPFLIACWPLKATSSYTGKGWEMFMNSFFTYVMLGLVVSVNVQLIGQGLTGGKGGFQAIEDALNGDQVQVLQDLLDIGFGGFLILIACCLFGFKLCGQAEQLAGKMAAGGYADNGAQIGGLAASGAKAATLGVGKAGLGATSLTAHGVAYLGEKTGVTPALRRGRDKVLGSVGKALGFGKNSGAAGGSKARAAAGGAAGGASTTAQSSNKPTSPNTPPTSPTSSSQAQQTQEAAPRNNGNQGDTRGSAGGSSGHTGTSQSSSGQSGGSSGNSGTSQSSSGRSGGSSTSSAAPQNLSPEDKATMDKANSFIQRSQRQGSMRAGTVSDEQRQAIFDRVRRAEQANASSRSIKGQGFSYQTDEVGNVDFSKKAHVNSNDLSESDKHLYDSIQSRKANEASLDVDGTFAMAKAHQALGGDPYTFGKKD
ncbi:MAG: hypothetical protein J6A33_04205 [Alphaproteobacteria bacterium]|nr:hypothetical protein [Alphaproteobacteria bacterium]